MRPAPEGRRHGERIDSLFLPPGTLIAASMELTVVQPANRDGGPVADFPPHRPLLGKLEVVRIGWRSPANQARFSGDKLQVFAIALTHRFADHRDFA